MKLIASLTAGALAAYFALIVVVTHLHTLSELMCNSDFSLPSLACRFTGLGVTVLLVPMAALVAGAFAWKLASR